MKNSPPKLARQILLSFLRQELVEEVLGDLDEKFYRMVRKNSSLRARLNYWLQVFNYFRPFALRKMRSSTINSPAMMKHTFLISFRTIQRYRSSFVINVAGLSAGLASVLLIYLWVADELSVDAFHRANLYQIMRNLEEEPNNIHTFDASSDLLAPALAAELSEVANAVSVTRPFPNGILSFGNKSFKATGKFASADFFKIMSYPLLQGRPENVFRDKYAIVISDVLARKIFGDVDTALGKTIAWDQKPYTALYTVTGIFRASGYQSSDLFDFIANHEVYVEHTNLFWDNNNVQTYLTLRPGTDVDAFNAKIKNFIKTKFQGLYGSENLHFIGTAFVRPYSEKYLYDRYENGVQSGGRIQYVKLFSTVATIILLIACVNFMNLSTARASRRLKEIGVKKAMGAFRKTLAFQHLGESIVIVGISLMVACLLVVLFLPEFNLITGKQLSITFDLNIAVALAVVLVTTGILAGSYPALYLSSFKSVDILRGKLDTAFSGAGVRKGLVIFQFTTTMFLMTGVVVVYQQIDFVQSKNLGYKKDNVITFRSEGKLNDQLLPFLTDIQGIPGVMKASTMGNDLGFPGGTGMVEWDGKRDRVEFNVLEVGYQLLELLEIPILQGRTFSEKRSGDSATVILNEMAVKNMGLADPFGKTIKLWHQDYQVIGVVDDFHFQSFHEAIKPCIIRLTPAARNVMVKVQAGTEMATIKNLERMYSNYNAGVPFDFHFLDDDYQRLYVSEKKIADLSLYFASIAVVISCLGLFGLAAFTAERRQKEMCLRKIFGLSEGGIIQLLSWDFTKMVLTSIAISLPLSYYTARNWLDGFAYKIDLQWWYFGAVSALALVMVWITVGVQLLRVATANVAHVLKNE